jgi:hypothetical protein
VCKRCGRSTCHGDRDTGDFCEWEADEFDQPLITPDQLQAKALEARVAELGATVGRLAPPGLDWVLLAWDGAASAHISNMGNETLIDLLRRTRADRALDDDQDIPF